ncbi:hypothetical protein HK44_017360 [Pseudomonas fluorescens HK44]|uniref:Uncharacterized protein n=1 Tax=Pseudomonas fluorescens HK44 TaxID=1042209 RepID=A0A010SEI1_PSEFL|nr:hypothetical protein HK44_017360 [Pseudomonas fluorescens HK44]
MFSRLPVTVPPPLLLQALAQIKDSDWHNHFNRDYYSGEFEGREDFIARRLGKLLQLGTEHCREFTGLAINYHELPGAMEGRLAGFFALSAEQRTLVFSAVHQHAKQPAETFVADSEGKQQEASARLRECVECWAHGPYEALEQWRTASCGKGACSRWAAERP